MSLSVQRCLLRHIIILLASITSLHSIAQNVIINGDFEFFTTAPTTQGQVSYANPWVQAVQSADYMNTSYTGWIAQTVVGAQSGTGYMGFASYGGANGAAEGIGQDISSNPIVPGFYHLKLYMKMTSGSSYNQVCGGISIFGYPSTPTGLGGIGVYAGNFPGSVLIWSSPTVSTTTWQYYEDCIQVFDTLSFIVFTNTYNISCPQYILIDSVSLVPSQPNCPQFYTVSAADTICTGDSTLLLSYFGQTQWWSTASLPNDTLSTDSILQVSPAVTTTYIGHSATGTDSHTVVVVGLPNTNLGPDTVLCDDPVTLSGSPGMSQWVWSNGSITQSATFSSSGTYWLAEQNAFGCINSDTINITINTTPVIDLGADTTLCDTTWLLNPGGSPAFTYLWSDNSSGTTLQINTSGTWSVIVSENGCETYDTITVSLDSMPVFDLGPDTSLCGISLLLDAGIPNLTYLWSNNNTTQFTSANQTGMYTCAVTQGTCTAYDSIHVTLHDPIPAFSLGQDIVQCGGSVSLTATGTSFTYSWSTGATTSTISATSSGTYWVEVINGLCTASDTINVTINDQPSIDLGPSRLICKDEQFNLNAYYPGATYLWSTGASQAIYTINAPGTYWVKASIGPCSDTDSISIMAATPPDIMQHGSLCDQGQVTLHAGEVRGDVLWSNGERRNPVYVNTPGTYVIEVLEEHCSMTDTVEVTGMVSDQLYLPNAFRPNSDGLNDVFPGTVEEAQDYLLVIYDRWGEQIFQSSDPSLNWDGTWNSHDATPGLYLYKVQYRSVCTEQIVEKSGHLTLIR